MQAKQRSHNKNPNGNERLNAQQPENQMKTRRPGPRFEPGSEDPQSSRMTNYPTLANVPFTFALGSD